MNNVDFTQVEIASSFFSFFLSDLNSTRGRERESGEGKLVEEKKFFFEIINLIKLRKKKKKKKKISLLCKRTQIQDYIKRYNKKKKHTHKQQLELL